MRKKLNRLRAVRSGAMCNSRRQLPSIWYTSDNDGTIQINCKNISVDGKGEILVKAA
jgi:hypothetical protein